MTARPHRQPAEADLMSAEQVRRYLGVSERFLTEHGAAMGRFFLSASPKSWRIKRTDLLAWVDRQQARAQQASAPAEPVQLVLRRPTGRRAWGGPRR